MKIKETMVLGEDFYSLAFYGYYKQPDDQILESLGKDSQASKKLDSIFPDKIN